MTNIPIGNSQVTIKFLMPSPGGLRNAALVFGVATSPDPVTLTQIITLYNDDVFHDLGSDKVSIVGGRMTDNVAIADSSVSFTGGHGGALPPPNVSLLVKKVTGLGGRINQGRMYPPGLVYENTYDDSGIMSAGSKDDYDDAFRTWLSHLDTMDASMVLLHTTEAGPTAITALSTELVASTQRRRLRR